MSWYYLISIFNLKYTLFFFHSSDFIDKQLIDTVGYPMIDKSWLYTRNKK